MPKQLVSQIVPPLSLLLLSIGSVALQAEENALRWNNEIGVGYGYESNVTVEEIDFNASLGDQYLTYDAKIGAKYQFTENQSVSLSIKGSEKQYQDAEQLDLSNRFISAGYAIKANKITYGVDFRFINTDLNDDEFLQLRLYSPYVSGFLSKQQFVRLGWNYGNKTLISQPDRDATSNQFTADYYYFVNGLKQYLILGAKYKNENTQDEQFSFDGLQLRAAYEFRFQLLERPTKARITTQYRKRDYDNANLNASEDDGSDQGDGDQNGDGLARQDKRQQVSLMLESEIIDNLAVNMQGAYIDNDSDIQSLSYHEKQLAMRVKYQF